MFNNIAHAVDLDMLRESYHKLDGNKAVGIDSVTKDAWRKGLEGNLQDLHAISDNQKSVKGFIYQTERALFGWRNRKGGRPE